MGTSDHQWLLLLHHTLSIGEHEPFSNPVSSQLYNTLQPSGAISCPKLSLLDYIIQDIISNSIALHLYLLSYYNLIYCCTTICSHFCLFAKVCYCTSNLLFYAILQLVFIWGGILCCFFRVIWFLMISHFLLESQP